MRIKLLFIILFFISSPVKGQDNNQLNSIITACLQSFINCKIDNGQVNNKYICRDGLPLDFSFDCLSNVSYISVNNYKYNSINLNKKLRKGLDVLFITFRLISNQLIITITERTVILVKKKTLDVAISDWGYYYYEYSCNTKCWELVETQYGGI